MANVCGEYAPPVDVSARVRVPAWPAPPAAPAPADASSGSAGWPPVL